MKKVLAALTVSAIAALSASSASAQQFGVAEWTGIGAAVVVAGVAIADSGSDATATTVTSP